MAEENITTSKVVYGAKSANDFIDKSFFELFKTKDPVNINRFFSMYNDLFYNIPQVGDKSHTTLIDKSRNYVTGYINPLQIEIDTLREEVIRLTEQLNETEEENPFYPNGTLIAPINDKGTPHGYNILYMDRGLARHVKGDNESDTFIALKASLGYPTSTLYDDIVLAVPQSIIDGIDRGPDLDIEDIAYPKAKDEAKRFEENIAAQNIVAITEVKNESWYRNYLLDNNVSNLLLLDFRQDLSDSINRAWKQEKQIESLRNEYINDIKYGYTEEERNNGQLLLDQLLGTGNQSNISHIDGLRGRGPYNKLNVVRDKLVIFSRIFETIKFTNTEDNLNNNLLNDILNLINLPISNSDRSFFEGKWNDNYFKELFPGIDKFVDVDRGGTVGEATIDTDGDGVDDASYGHRDQ